MTHLMPKEDYALVQLAKQVVINKFKTCRDRFMGHEDLCVLAFDKTGHYVRIQLGSVNSDDKDLYLYNCVYSESDEAIVVTRFVKDQIVEEYRERTEG